MRPGWVRVSAQSSGAGEVPQGRCDDDATCQAQPGPSHPCPCGCRAILTHRHPIPRDTLPARCAYLELLKPRVPPARGAGHLGLQVEGGQGL